MHEAEVQLSKQHFQAWAPKKKKKHNASGRMKGAGTEQPVFHKVLSKHTLAKENHSCHLKISWKYSIQSDSKGN